MLSLKVRNTSELDIDITPLLDVVFILLIFFIIASAFAVRGLDMDVPEARTSAALSGRIIEIRLDEQGNIYGEDVLLHRDELKMFLFRSAESFKERPGKLVLKAHPQAPVEALVFIVDSVRLQGGERLMIMTSEPHDSGSSTSNQP